MPALVLVLLLCSITSLLVAIGNGNTIHNAASSSSSSSNKHKVESSSGTTKSKEAPVPVGSVMSPVIPQAHPMRIAFQGEPGAYSEKAAREMLGSRIMTVPYRSFEDTFKAVASREVDYAIVPIENSLGGSIHNNFDNLLRYDLHIIGRNIVDIKSYISHHIILNILSNPTIHQPYTHAAEHEFRVEHSLLALPGVKKEDVKKVLSHPQALAQCDNYLRSVYYLRYSRCGIYSCMQNFS